MRIGINFTPKHDSPQHWADILTQKGYRASSFPVNHRASVSLIDEYVKEAKAHDIRIAEVGVWNSPHHTDKQESLKAREYCLGQFELAEYVHADCCVNVSGAAGERWSYCYKENYSQALYEENVRFIQEMCDKIKPKHTSYALEPMQWMLPWDAKQYKQFLKDVDRSCCKVHMDIFNFVKDPYIYTHQEELMDDAFELLGSDIVSCHIKDIRLDVGTTVSIHETPIGTGEGNIGYYLNHISQLTPDMPVLIEHLSKIEDFDAALSYLKENHPKYF